MKPILPELLCLPISLTKTDSLEAVEQAFHGHPSIGFQQAWLPAPQPNLLPTIVRTGWDSKAVWIFADMKDIAIHNSATKLNEHLWELGDVFECFVRPLPGLTYYEFHVSPENQRLQLKFANSQKHWEHKAAKEGMTSFMLEGQAIQTHTWVTPGEEWKALMRIPASTLHPKTPYHAGDVWKFSFSRYDVTDKVEDAVLSSSSPHKVCGYHRQQEWGTLKIANR